MRRFVPLLVIAACMPVGACSGTIDSALAKLISPPHEITNDIPAALPMNTERSRKLFLIIVQALHDDGKSSAAIAYLRQYEKIYPSDPRAERLLADCLVESHQDAAAIPIYAALSGSDEAAAGEAGRGRIAGLQGDWAEAIPLFQQASTRDAANTAYLNDLGYAQIMTARYDVAIATLHQASELAPENVMIRNNLILALHLSGHDPEARAIITAITSSGERARGNSLLLLDAAALHVPPKLQTVASADDKPTGATAR